MAFAADLEDGEDQVQRVEVHLVRALVALAVEVVGGAAMHPRSPILLTSMVRCTKSTGSS